jgi:hypothetical protein
VLVAARPSFDLSHPCRHHLASVLLCSSLSEQLSNPPLSPASDTRIRTTPPLCIGRESDSRNHTHPHADQVQVSKTALPICFQANSKHLPCSDSLQSSPRRQPHPAYSSTSLHLIVSACRPATPSGLCRGQTPNPLSSDATHLHTPAHYSPAHSSPSPCRPTSFSLPPLYLVIEPSNACPSGLRLCTDCTGS